MRPYDIVIYPGYLQYEWLWVVPFGVAAIVAVSVAVYRWRAKKTERIINEVISEKAHQTATSARWSGMTSRDSLATD